VTAFTLGDDLSEERQSSIATTLALKGNIQ
jgi:hypothetical protein